MNKVLLLGALLCSTLSFSQSLTFANEPAIAQTQSMFLCDSFADTYPTITGSGVTWDYSDLAFFPGITRSVTIEDATSATYASDFPTATKTINVENTLTTYFHSDANGRVSAGFVFTEATFGDLLAVFDTDEETLVSYPFALGGSLSDSYSGTLYFDFNGIAQSPAAAGNAYAWIDGQGTLIAADGSSIPNVIRYKLVDTTLTNVVIFGDLEVVRTQYEYYDLANSNLPILTFSRIVMQQPGGGAAIADNSVVLSVALPTEIVGLDEAEDLNYTVYPNPTEDNIKLQGDFDNDATAAIYDQSGRILMNLPVSNGTSIDLSSFNTGMYLLKVTNNGAVTTKTVVKK
ncbi:MAG: T9SS type A sorting domain-containing protein [Crocinitomicaceae bacterium]|nr:T9SS type A sorting domain-containing protein [Crocinitomicaceae bacterium]